MRQLIPTCWCVTMLRCYDVTMLQCYDVTMLQCYDVTMLRCYDVTMLRCVETFQETSALADRLVQDQMKYANQEEELYSLKRKLSLSLQSDPNTSTTTTTPDVLVSCYLCMTFVCSLQWWQMQRNCKLSVQFTTLIHLARAITTIILIHYC